MTQDDLPRSPRARAFGAEYRGLSDGVRAASASGYQGSPSALAQTASRLLRDPKVQALVRARGVAVPSDERVVSEEPPREAAPSDLAEFFRKVQSGELRVTPVQLKAAERRLIMEKAAAPDTSAEARFEELRAQVAVEIRGIREREASDEGP